MPPTLAKKQLRKKRQRRTHARARTHAKRRRVREYRDEHVVQPPTVPPKPDPKPGGGGKLPPPPDTNHRNAERLLWRAGFGPRPGDVEHVVSIGIPAAVHELVYPAGTARLIGPEPSDEDGNALAPFDAWGHDHLWWL
ncbi:MAG: hypothetical protein QOH38_1021, partial [Thermoleophilaceae bacterium]|nr:hypothetical protein [Thermoleophilaceae bacterium]